MLTSWENKTKNIGILSYAFFWENKKSAKFLNEFFSSSSSESIIILLRDAVAPRLELPLAAPPPFRWLAAPFLRGGAAAALP